MQLSPGRGRFARTTLLWAVLTLAAGCDRPTAAAAPGQPPPASRPVAPPPPPAAPAREPPRVPVHIVPIGDVPAETLAAAVRGLRGQIPVEPVLVAARPLPPSARVAKSARYRAEVLLAWLEALPLPRTGKVLGITEVDIVTRKGKHENWGILGLGSIDGPGCVLSTFRMRRRWEKGGAPPSLVRERLWKVSVHELGHTLGLDHCPVRGCLMEDGHGTVKTTDRSTALCSSCASRYAARLRALAPRPSR
ncbi:MAG: matrixin family metalloprotease [Deltaproteobacteria bacterium]|nr:matrixin family metalloprotease [Deltaproteobacteria bacterium]